MPVPFLSRRLRAWFDLFAEPLERRLVLDTLFVGGTPNSDAIIMEIVNLSGVQTVRVLMNLIPFTMPDAVCTAVFISSSTGSDTIGVASNTDNTIQIDAGPDDDNINLMPPGNNMVNFTADMTIAGGAGADYLNIQDQGRPELQLYDITFDRIDFIATPTGNVDYSGIESLELRGGPGGARFDVISTTIDTLITIRGNSGIDRLVVGSFLNGLDEVLRRVTFDAQDDSDLLEIVDIGGTAAGNYLLDPTQFMRDASPLVDYTDVSNITIHGTDGDDEIAVHSLAFGVRLTVIGNSGNDDLRLGTGPQSLAFFKSVFFEARSGIDTVYINDQNGGFSTSSYFVGTAFFAAGTGSPAPFELSYLDCEDLVLNGSAFPNEIVVPEAPAGFNVTINAGDGDDRITFGHSTAGLTLIQQGPTVNGGAGSDTVVADDSSFTGTAGYTCFTFGGATIIGGPGFSGITYGATERVNVLGSSGNNSVSVDLSTSDAVVGLTLGSGDDDVLAVISVPTNVKGIDVNGGGNFDTMTISDSLNAAATAWGLTAATITRSFVTFSNYSQMERVTLNCGPGNNQINVTGTATGVTTRLNGGDGIDFFVIQAVSTRPLIDGGPGLDNVQVSNNAAAGTVGNQDLGSVTLIGNAKLLLDFGTATVTSTLAINMGALATLDVFQGTLIDDYDAPNDPTAFVGSLLTTGYDGGAWNATGITTYAPPMIPAAGLGFAHATDLFNVFPATFAGRTIDSTTVLIRHTIYGDATLDRTVNISDFALLASNFNLTVNRWSLGDFNFDNSTGISDFALLGSNFNRAYAAPVPADPARALAAQRWHERVDPRDDPEVRLIEAI